MLRTFLRNAPANLLVRYRYDGGLVTKVRGQLRSIPPSSWPDFEIIAKSLRLSPSTLRQRLRSDSQTYRAIKDEIRREMALDYLMHSKRCVGEIATELGYAEPSAFHRAFRNGHLRVQAHSATFIMAADCLSKPYRYALQRRIVCVRSFVGQQRVSALISTTLR